MSTSDVGSRLLNPSLQTTNRAPPRIQSDTKHRYAKIQISQCDLQWVDPVGPIRTHDVINPATEEVYARIALGSKEDVDRAVQAAKDAFPAFSVTSPEYRAELLEKIVVAYNKRKEAIAESISKEMGAPMWLAKTAQQGAGSGHFRACAEVLRKNAIKFTENRGSHIIRREPIGVCGFICPWNWPANQIGNKIAPAIAAGCTSVLKPSEFTPIDAILIMEAIHEAGVPKGVVNLVNGDGPGVGQWISSHPEIEMVSFTGSTRAGIEIAKAAAPTVKRVAQELGGKSPNIITPDAPLEEAVTKGVITMMNNSGQSCNAPSRMLIHRPQYQQAVEIAAKVAQTIKVSDPVKSGRGEIGPVANINQFKKIQALLQKGIDEGASAVVGGPGKPEGFDKGYYIKPTIFANVNNNMTIAREEIFGPVLCMIPYDNLEHAIQIANDTPYGLSAYVYAKDSLAAAKIASRLRAGQVLLQGKTFDSHTPFGGYKQSGNGREAGEFGILEFLEVKAVVGAPPEAARL
ncbi:aldehyde dehydrogenase family protein [Gonapodya prolifera JEL478]|uniref:Aldehyde dehydrogenase family protein n=1 Tax=Gonapodya prolifera (strain JEL478) TaxID=1344416 RepID=A0A138ZY37_GONPJ|nr:aldehyde dehydrogenase family protein [Gonapodya prolifera JEL478]|eukprot:KXS09404.1 aldehyde dehydrogenase family protein [Gonapodya prolifera JEL478]